MIRLTREQVEKLKKEIIDELGNKNIRLDKLSDEEINHIVSKVKQNLQEVRLDSEEVIVGLLKNIQTTEEEKKVDFYRDEIFSPRIKSAFQKSVLDQIATPKNGQPGPQGEPGKDAQPIPLTEKDKKEIANFVDVTKLIKDRKQDLVLLIEQLKSGKIKLPSHAGIDVKEIIAEFNKIIGTDDWQNALPGDGSLSANLTQIQFTTGLSAPDHSAGLLFYDTDDDELCFYDIVSGTKLNIGSEMRIKVRNSSGSAIADFTPVYQTGAIGNRATIDLAKADSEATSMVIAVTTNLIGDNTNGSATSGGTINEVDTDGSVYGESWNDGDEIFLSATTAGFLTNVAPTGNNIKRSIGKVLVATNNGSFEVKIDGADVVGISSSTDNSIVRFDGTSGKRIKESTGINASEISIATGVGSPTINQVQEYLNNTGSSGFFLGGALSDGGAGTLNVAAGSGFIRATNDNHAELQSFKWSESLGIAVTDNTTQYVYVDDSGVISLSTDEFLETPDKIQIGVVTKEGGVVEHVFSLGVRLQESIGQAGRFIRRVFGLSRDKRKGGLIFGQSGDANRDVTLTAGIIWWGRTEYPIPLFNTSGADTFSTYSASGQEEATASQWNNLQYDNAGTLTALGNNKWANLFFFIEPDNHIVMVYGRAEHNSEIAADNEAVPSSSLPSKITETSLLAARFTFQKSSNIATIASAFAQLFANAGVADHGDMAGLVDDDHAQYLLLAGRSPNQTLDLTNPTLFTNMKSGATQGAAGASAGEIWRTVSHATLPDNVIMIGV